MKVNVSDIIKLYKPSYEFEIRINNDIIYDHAIVFIENLKQITENSVNIISNMLDKNNNLEKNTKKIITKINDNTYYSTKRNIISTKLPEYKISLSEENKINKFDIPNSGIVRIKSRISTDILPNWRLDLTIVNQFNYSDKRTLNLADVKKDVFEKKIGKKEIELEYIGDNLTLEEYESCINILNKISNVFDPLLYVSKLLGSHLKEFKSILNSAISINKSNYFEEIYPPLGYYLTDKADGERAILLITNGESSKIYLIFSNRFLEFENKTGLKLSIFDTEFVNDTIYLFDCMYYNGEKLLNRAFAKRHKYLIPVNFEIKCESKKYIHLSKYVDLENNFKSIYTKNTKKSYEIDGLILTSPAESYSETFNLKWKPENKNTIDFLVRKSIKQNGLDYKEGLTKYILFVGITHDMQKKLNIEFYKDYKQFNFVNGNYFPIQFSPSVNPRAYVFYHSDDTLDGKIVELSCSNCSIMPNWKFEKIRTDRKPSATYYGNDFKTAELTYINYIDPFPFENLYLRSDGYFSYVANKDYTASNKYRRFIITKVFEKYIKGANWLIDEGVGKGADIYKYSQLGIANALFVDNDSEAIANLVLRKFAFLNYDSKLVHTKSYELLLDLNINYEKSIARFEEFGAMKGNIDVIVSNFALHYFCVSTEYIKNILILNSTMLKSGGLFIFSLFNKSVVEEKMGNSMKWVLMEKGVEKYAIYKTGNNISVKLPFTDKLVEEPLVDIENFIKIASKYKFTLLERFAMNNIQNKDFNLSDVDIEYSGLYEMVILQKK